MYIVLEIQKNTEGQVGVIPLAYATMREAEGRFHQVLAVAAESQLPVHAAVILTEDGGHLRSECYQRAAVPEEPDEPEPTVPDGPGGEEDEDGEEDGEE